MNCDSNNFVRNVNNVLRRNRRILEAVLEVTSPVISRYQLTSLGFDFRYFTHLKPQRKGIPVYFCYEYGYRELDGDDLTIVHEEPSPEYRSVSNFLKKAS